MEQKSERGFSIKKTVINDCHAGAPVLINLFYFCLFMVYIIEIKSFASNIATGEMLSALKRGTSE